MFHFLHCVPTDLPGKPDRPLRPPGWSAHTWDRRQTTHFLFLVSNTVQPNLHHEKINGGRDENILRPRSHRDASKPPCLVLKSWEYFNLHVRPWEECAPGSLYHRNTRVTHLGGFSHPVEFLMPFWFKTCLVFFFFFSLCCIFHLLSSRSLTLCNSLVLLALLRRRSKQNWTRDVCFAYDISDFGVMLTACEEKAQGCWSMRLLSLMPLLGPVYVSLAGHWGALG